MCKSLDPLLKIKTEEEWGYIFNVYSVPKQLLRLSQEISLRIRT
jgi:hypothetical protein